MKKSVIVQFAVLLFLTAGTLQSQAQAVNRGISQNNMSRKELRKLNGDEVSDLAKTNFAGQFGNLTGVEWKRMDTFDEATFTKDGKKITAWYDFDAKLVGTTNYTTFDKVPAAGQKGIKSLYKDFIIGSVLFFDDNEANETDMVLYARQFDDADNYFVELEKNTEKIVVMVNPEGKVSLFKKLK